MKKRLIIITGIVIIIIGIIAYLYLINREEEYIPEEEIGIQDSRETFIDLYYQNKETKEMEAESRKINIKDLLLNPYDTILKMLFKSPESEELERIIPEDISLDITELDNYVLKIEMSAEKMIEDEELKNRIKESITKTLTQLNEVSSVEIKINDVQI